MNFPAKIPPSRERLVNSVVRASIAVARAQFRKGEPEVSRRSGQTTKSRLW
jgi:hypothetical protein